MGPRWRRRRRCRKDPQEQERRRRRPRRHRLAPGGLGRVLLLLTLPRRAPPLLQETQGRPAAEGRGGEALPVLRRRRRGGGRGRTVRPAAQDVVVDGRRRRRRRRDARGGKGQQRRRRRGPFPFGPLGISSAPALRAQDWRRLVVIGSGGGGGESEENVGGERFREQPFAALAPPFARPGLVAVLDLGGSLGRGRRRRGRGARRRLPRRCPGFLLPLLVLPDAGLLARAGGQLRVRDAPVPRNQHQGRRGGRRRARRGGAAGREGARREGRRRDAPDEDQRAPPFEGAPARRPVARGRAGGGCCRCRGCCCFLASVAHGDDASSFLGLFFRGLGFSSLFLFFGSFFERRRR